MRTSDDLALPTCVLDETSQYTEHDLALARARFGANQQTLVELAQDPDPRIRECLTSNVRCSDAVLRSLLDDENEVVSCSAARTLRMRRFVGGGERAFEAVHAFAVFVRH